MGLDRRLYDAVKAGNAELVQKLLQGGANPHAPVGKKKMTALDRATLAGNSSLLDLLHEYAATQVVIKEAEEGAASSTFVQMRPKGRESDYLTCFDGVGELDPRKVRMSTLATSASSSLKRGDYFSGSSPMNPSGTLVQHRLPPSDRTWEFDRTKLRQIRKLGQGTFGVVFEGVAEGIVDGEQTTRVAVKMLTEEGEDLRRNFANEVKIMMAIDGPHHIVRLLGVCTDTPPLLMVMELMARGDLKTVLRDARPKPKQPSSLSQQRLARMGADIAEGMAYLASLNIVHRDLAARNCLVSEDLTVKVGDFGLTRDTEQGEYYRMTGSAPLPVRWMSPEAIMDGIYTVHSDVWSFGIVLWELFSFAKMPYAGLSNSEICDMVCEEGYRLKPPRGCPQLLAEVMRQCWDEEPTLRGSFSALEGTLTAAAASLSSDPVASTTHAGESERVHAEGEEDEEGQREGDAEARDAAYVLEADKDRELPLYIDERYTHLSSMDLALRVAKQGSAVEQIEAEVPRSHTILRRAVAEDLRDGADALHTRASNPNIYQPALLRPSQVARAQTMATPPSTPTNRAAAAAVSVSGTSSPSTPRPAGIGSAQSTPDTLRTPNPAAGASGLGAEDKVKTLLTRTKLGGSTSRNHLANDVSATATKVRRATTAAASRAEQEMQEWVGRVLGRPLPATLEDALRSGEVLCELMNRISAGSVLRVHSDARMAFKQMENIGYFLDACHRYGVADADMFMTVDLFRGSNMKQVVICLNALKIKAMEKGLKW
eukprot:m.131312 g.131312  ORF g.131312 m.131312 type:complete len:769 (-) comp14792_c0_seq8:37-2343(-)